MGLHSRRNHQPTCETQRFVLADGTVVNAKRSPRERRAAFRGVLIGNMGYSAGEANAAIAAGQLDAVAFGTAFLANPDLPERIRRGAALTAPDPATFYTPGPRGYTDYPTLAEGA